MATGKKAKDIFTKTADTKPTTRKAPSPGLGRPKTAEPYTKVTVCLFDRQTLWMDKVSLAIREKTGQHIARAELVRGILDYVQKRIVPDPSSPDFEKAARSFLPGL